MYWFCHTVCESIAKSDAKEIWPLNNWLISISYSIFSHLNFDYRLIINCESTFTQKLFLFGLVKIMLYSNLSKKNTNTKTYCDNGHWFSLSILNHHLLSTTLMYQSFPSGVSSCQFCGDKTIDVLPFNAAITRFFDIADNKKYIESTFKFVEMLSYFPKWPSIHRDPKVLCCTFW